MYKRQKLIVVLTREPPELTASFLTGLDGCLRQGYFSFSLAVDKPEGFLVVEKSTFRTLPVQDVQ